MTSMYTQRSKSFNASFSSNTICRKYDVFLSFRGDDTRGNFLEYLYRALRQKGILTFKDNDRLEDGEDIKDGLLNAIAGSRFSIVVLSVNYASSSWCLDELVQIIQCKRASGHVVYPVFYHVEPMEVRKMKGEFGERFAKEASENKEKVEKWTEALCEVANSKGWAYPGTRFKNEAELIDDLVQKIFIESIKMYKIAAEDLVGIRDRMVEVIKLLDLGSDETRVVGLWGMGGIGKTTLAKVVYDSIAWQFESCSFVDNVREVFNKSGVLALQEHLISDILMEDNFKLRSVMRGTSIIQNRVCRKKVLIVLDDVSEPKQLEDLVVGLHLFTPGTRIIITTRNQHVLTVYGSQNVYNVHELKKSEAMELFKSKAFAGDGETGEFQLLINRAVQYANGVPLALKVLGSFLLGGTLPEWESALDRLSEGTDDELQQVLRISYEGLHWTEKAIFLDICCFYIGAPEDWTIKILDGCGFNPFFGINVLVKKSLLIISVDGLLSMHDLVKKMGWTIVYEESRKEPGERSRLWRPEEVKDVLMDKAGTKNVEGILVDLENVKLRVRFDAFSKMINLRFLSINGALLSFIDPPTKLHLICGFLRRFHCNCGARRSIDLPNKLRLLFWENCPLKCMPSTFQPEHLVSLSLLNSRIEQLWDKTMALPKLTILQLENSKSLTKCPDFTGFPNLEYVVLKGCTALVDLHPSIRKLKKVNLLNLKGCSSFQTLPYGIESQCLESLSFSGCLKINNILESFEHLEGISKLDLNGTAITELHHSIGNCTNLSHLDLSNCIQLESIPQSICQFRKLIHLSVFGCSSLSQLPEKVGDINSLELLDISFSGVRQLPESVARLRNLQKFVCRQYRGTPPCFSGFRSLIWLNLGFSSLTAIPESIFFCVSLKELYLYVNDFEYLPASIKNLSNLERLAIDDCKRLQELPELPSTIQYFNASGCVSLKTICSPTVLRNASYFWFENCPKLVDSDEIKILMGYKFLFNQMKVITYGSYRFPGSKVPEWFTNRNVGGLLTFHLPILGLKDPNLLGIAFSAVVAIKDQQCRIGLHVGFGRTIFNFDNIRYLRSNSEDVIVIFYYPIKCFTLDHITKAKTVLEVCFLTPENDEIESYESDKALKPAPEIKECGARLIYT